MIELAAQLHDIGKIGIPDAILLKPAKLTPEEYAVMKKHCEYGKAIVDPTTDSEAELARKYTDLGLMPRQSFDSPFDDGGDGRDDASRTVQRFRLSPGNERGGDSVGRPDHRDRGRVRRGWPVRVPTRLRFRWKNAWKSCDPAGARNSTPPSTTPS